MKEGVNLDVDYSLRSTIDTIKDALNPLEKVADKLISAGNKHAGKIADPAGVSNPNSIDTTVTQKQKVKRRPSPRERSFEASRRLSILCYQIHWWLQARAAHKIKTIR